MAFFPTIGDFIGALMSYPLEVRLQVIAIIVLGFGVSWYLATRIKMAKYRLNAYKAIELSKKIQVVKKFVEEHKGDVKAEAYFDVKNKLWVVEWLRISSPRGYRVLIDTYTGEVIGVEEIR